MSDLEARLSELLALKEGEDFALSYIPGVSSDPWKAEIVNPSGAVRLGETDGVYSGNGSTPLEAIQRCLENVRDDITRDDEFVIRNRMSAIPDWLFK